MRKIANRIGIPAIILFLAIGIIGQYIGKVYLETKERPKFIIETYLSDEDTDADKDKTQK